MKPVLVTQFPAKQQEVIPLVIESFKRFNIVSKIYLATNDTLYKNDEVSILRLPKDYNFSTNLMKLLKTVEENIIFLHHDILIDVDKPKFFECCDLLNSDKNVLSIRLVRDKKDVLNDADSHYIQENKAKCPLQGFGTLFKKDVLQKILIPGESIWGFTKHAYARKSFLFPGGKIMCTSFNIIKFYNCFRRTNYITEQFIKFAEDNNYQIKGKYELFYKDTPWNL